jgi:hypothetical protein
MHTNEATLDTLGVIELDETEMSELNGGLWGALLHLAYILVCEWPDIRQGFIDAGGGQRP